MKKRGFLLMTVCILIVGLLAGCGAGGGQDESQTQSNTGAASENESSAATTEEDSTEASSEAETDGDGTEGKTLVVYFSATFFMISLIIQQLYREILAVADEMGGKLENRCVFFCDEYGTLPKIESAEMMFSASRSRRLQIVPVIQSFAQLEKNYGKEGAEIIVDNTQLTIFGGFAPNSSSAEVLSKALGSRTVMSGSVSRGKNDPSQSLQMMERALMTPDELKSMPKGQFIVMKTGFYPMKVKLKLFFKWGIQFEEEYAVEEKGNRKVAYAEKQEILDGIVKKYHPEWLMENAPPAEAIPPAGGQAQAMTERNQPSSREKGKGGGTGLRTAPRAARPERKAEEGIRESRMLHLPKTAEVSEDGQA